MASREEVLERRVFSAGDRAFRWRDVVAAARAWGDWAEIELRGRHALALVAEPAEDSARGDREAAQAAFRYKRGLLAADDLQDWLDRWAVGLHEWAAQVESERRRDEAGELEANAEALAGAAWAEAIGSGRLERLARRLAECVAVRLAEGGDVSGEDGDAEELRRGLERFRERAVTPEILERFRAEAQLDLVRLECRVFAHPDEDVTREAALCAQEEGRDLEEVAAEAGARLDSRQFFVGDIESDWRPLLLAAGAGDLVGPLSSRGESCLLEVVERAAPSLDDDEVRSRLATRAMDSRVEREVLGRIRWHERLGD